MSNKCTCVYSCHVHVCGSHSCGDVCFHFSGTASGMEQSLREEQERRAETETQVQLYSGTGFGLPREC